MIRPENWKDGLIVRTPNWLGDLVMTFPAMMQLKKILPEFCGMVVICPKGLAPVVEALDIVDEVIPLENPHAFPAKDELASLYHRHFGAGVLFNNSLRDAVILRKAGIHPLFGAAARGRSFLLKKSIRFPKRRDHVLNHPHQAQKYMAVASLLGADTWDGVSMPHLTIEMTDDEFARKHNLPAFPGGPILSIAPGAAYGDAKCWAASNFREVAGHWLSVHGGSVLFLGGKNEIPVCQTCADGFDSSRVFNLAGTTSLTELMFLLKRSAACTANDSGVMHLAAALDIPGAVPFGSTDPAATSPLSKKWTVLYEKEPCSPCFKRICPLGTRKCFDALTPSRLIDALEAQLLPRP